MDIMELTKVAYDIIDSVGYETQQNNGLEVSPGWINVYNTQTGQSRTVLYHPESGYCFKQANEEDTENTASGRFLGTVEWLGKVLTVRLPNYIIDHETGITAQEFVVGTSCDHFETFCPHTRELADV